MYDIAADELDFGDAAWVLFVADGGENNPCNFKPNSVCLMINKNLKIRVKI